MTADLDGSGPLFSLCSHGVKRAQAPISAALDRQKAQRGLSYCAGRQRGVDGDTLEIHGTRIRLWGIDAPESSQLCRGEDSLQYRCGAKAANELDTFISKRPVSCIPISLDQYGRTVATCSVGGVDLGEWLVRNGLALDWPQYSRGRYDEVQREAEHAGRGLWEGSYVEPWLFRVCIRAGGRPAECSDDANAHP
jgi:endonuclease YncB( thermonuclease family)